ncbi:MAG: hypothetical protein ACHQCE_01545 [Streptosporangiales bacterium]
MPASRPPRRWRPALPAVGIVLAVLAPAVAGCATFDRTFGKQEAIVQFQSQTPNSVRLKVRAAGSHVPPAGPQPRPPHPQASDLDSDVRYRVDHASDGDLAKLQQCLQRFPSVVGIEFNGPAGS